MASTRCPEQKVILCGEYGVGKSSLFRRFANNTFVTSTDRASTLGLDHFEKSYKYNNKDAKVDPNSHFRILPFKPSLRVLNWYPIFIRFFFFKQI